jgi:hypothetical protein
MFIAAAAAAAAAAVAASSLSFLRVAAAASGPLYAPPRALFNPPTATASTIQPGGCNAARRPLPAPTCGHYRGAARFLLQQLIGSIVFSVSDDDDDGSLQTR